MTEILEFLTNAIKILLILFFLLLFLAMWKKIDSNKGQRPMSSGGLISGGLLGALRNWERRRLGLHRYQSDPGVKQFENTRTCPFCGKILPGFVNNCGKCRLDLPEGNTT